MFCIPQSSNIILGIIDNWQYLFRRFDCTFDMIEFDCNFYGIIILPVIFGNDRFSSNYFGIVGKWLKLLEHDGIEFIFVGYDFCMLNKKYTIMLSDDETYRGVYKERIVQKKTTVWPSSESNNKYLQEYIPW